MQSTFVEKTAGRSSRSIASQITSLKGKSMPAVSKFNPGMNADSNVVQREIKSMREPEGFGDGWIWWDTDDFVKGGSFATYSVSKKEYIGDKARSILLGAYPPSEREKEVGPPKPAVPKKMYGPTMPPPEEEKAKGSGATDRFAEMRLATRRWISNHSQHPAARYLDGFAWGEAPKKDIHGPSGHITTQNGAHIFFKNGEVVDATAPGQTSSSGGAVLHPFEKRW